MSLVTVHDFYHLRTTHQLCSSWSLHSHRMVASHTISETQLLPRLDDLRTGTLIIVIVLKNVIFPPNSHFSSLNFYKINIFKVSISAKLSFSKPYHSQNSRYQNLNFLKNHISEILQLIKVTLMGPFSTKITFFK